MFDQGKKIFIERKWTDRQYHVQDNADVAHQDVKIYFNTWNIIQLSQKSTPSDAFYEINQVVLDGISDNIALLVQSVNYGAINTIDGENNGFYVIMFQSEVYTLQDNTTIDGQVITSGEFFVKEQYLCSMQVYTNWY